MNPQKGCCDWLFRCFKPNPETQEKVNIPKDGRIFMIGIKTNKGYHRVIECLDESEEKGAILEFFNVIDQIKPSIIGGYNSANFDWHWLFERGQRLGIDMRKAVKSLHPQHSYTRKDTILKLANEVEDFLQTSIWGYNVIDIIHAVRRAQAINSNIKSAGLKYITKFINKEAPDRVYIEHTDIGKMYSAKDEYWLNIQNGKYKKVGQDETIDNVCKRRDDVYILTTGDNLVERYLDDDLEETLAVDKEFNQASFLLASMIPTTYERVSTMGTATLWKMLMLAWSYKHELAIPAKQDKTDFVGGLSRLLKVGYSKNVLKLDFSSLYPSIQLVHDVFPDCDVTGAMKGMGQIVTWSVRDETLHCNSMIKIFNTFCDENPGLLDESLKKEIYDACRTIVHHEDAFIDLAFEMGNIEGLTAEQCLSITKRKNNMFHAKVCHKLLHLLEPIPKSSHSL